MLSTQRLRRERLYAVTRTCSAYTEPDIVVGVFRQRVQAKKARKAYIQMLHDKGDPHKEQGYMKVNLWRDVRIRRVPWYRKSSGVHRTSGDPVYLFIEVSELFGQIVSRCCAAFDSMDDLLEMGRTASQRLQEDPFPSYCMFDSLQLGDIRYDNDWKCLPLKRSVN